MKKRDALDYMLNRIIKQFPNVPEAKCCAAVACQSIRDVIYPSNSGIEKYAIKDNVEEAERYLAGEMPHAAIWGVEADWIRHLIFSLRAEYDSRT